MQVDFYQLAGTPIERVVPQLAEKIVESGERLLLVSEDETLLGLLDKQLWAYEPSAFLPHAKMGEGDAAEQPILLSDQTEAPNDAAFVMLADGIWRDAALDFQRVFYVFDNERIDDARTAWRALSAEDDVEPRYWKNDGGKWRQGP